MTYNIPMKYHAIFLMSLELKHENYHHKITKVFVDTQTCLQ